MRAAPQEPGRQHSAVNDSRRPDPRDGVRIERHHHGGGGGSALNKHRGHGSNQAGSRATSARPHAKILNPAASDQCGQGDLMANMPIFYQQERSFIAYASKHLTKSDMLVYDVLCANSYGRYGINYVVNIGYKAMAEQAVIERSTAIKSCAHLEEHGWIKRAGFSSAKCVRWVLVHQSPKGIAAAQELAIKLAREQGKGVTAPTPPTDEGVTAPTPPKSPDQHHQSLPADTLLRTPRRELQDSPVTTPPKEAGPEPAPEPEPSLYDLGAGQKIALEFEHDRRGMSLEELLQEKAAGWKDGEPVNGTTPTAAYLCQLERVHEGEGDT